MKAKTLFVVLILFACNHLFGQDKQIKTIEKSNSNQYPWIRFLSMGDEKWNKEETQGIAFRFIITTSEIYDQIIIEEIHFGEEGGGKTVFFTRQVDLIELAEAFKIYGEISGIEFIKWKEWNSFEVKILDRKFLFKNIEKPILNVKEI
jgi:hypothetical protein